MSSPRLLPPPPPKIPENVVPIKADAGNITEGVKRTATTERLPMARPGLGTKGQKIQLVANHFKVHARKFNGYFFQYSVAIFYEDGHPANVKGIGRRVLNKVYETYGSELANMNFAYDGEKTLYTLDSLPQNKQVFTVVLEEISSNRTCSPSDGDYNDSDRKRQRRPYQSKTFRVEINYATKIPLMALKALDGEQSDKKFQEAVRVLDIILRQHAAKQGCLLVRQSFFHDELRNYTDVGGGVLGCRGFHSSFRATQGGLSLNIDVSTTMVVRPGPVVDFLTSNQNVKDFRNLDWVKARKTLKNLRVKVSPSNAEYKITGLSDKPCKYQMFLMKQKDNKEGGGEIEMTVYNYFVNNRHIALRFSGDCPCINVGKAKRPTYIPIELCSLVSLQRYAKALSTFQRASLVEKSRQKPNEQMRVLTDALRRSNYDAEPMLQSSEISISSKFTQVEGRVLPAPKLKFGNGEEFFPRNGRWNLNNKKLVQPTSIDNWAIVNFSARCDTRSLCRDLINCAAKKGISITDQLCVVEESHQNRRASAPDRVNEMIEAMKGRLSKPPKFILCLLPERKNSDIYGPWKRKNLVELGIVTQCISPTRVNDQYLTNVLLKINAKLGGMNSLLTVEHIPSIPVVSNTPTLILGMDVSHGSTGRSDVPSIAAVVSSRHWPLVSRYRASVRAQSPKSELIESLFKPVQRNDNDIVDKGIIRELLLDFYASSGQRKPSNIIIFRDGVSESQFNQVLNIELDQIIEACKFLDDKWSPEFTFIVAQKNHRTKFFQVAMPDNVPPGTVVDNGDCHPRNNDFYMCSHAGMIGTTRPTHYHVLFDELGFSADDLQQLVHSLSYVYQKSTTAVSIVAPICYAHLAAAQLQQFLKFDEMSDTSSSHNGVASGNCVSYPELPELNLGVRSSMFFC